MPDPTNRIFVPWVQPGVAANIPDAATDKPGAHLPGIVSLPVTLVVNAEAVAKTVRLYGPGDVMGIDPQQVVRLEPRPHTTDFEPNYFPAIEFDRPDFPWLFTPAKSDPQGQGRLRPWLCLVVVRKQKGVELRPASAQPLPVLEIKAPAKPGDELPDLSESWAWAHAQVTGSTKDQLGGDPAKSVSRLLCPRRLDPTTEYLACVVPTFELGRKAGLNLPITSDDEKVLQPAWSLGAPSPPQQPPLPVTLPVYYHWEFRTGVGGDFEALVRRLVPRELQSEVGKRPMDISHPGFDLQPPPDAASAVLGLEGALRPLNGTSDIWADASRLPFQSELIKILNTPWHIATQDGAGQDPIVAPPIYGCWQAAVHEVGTINPSPPAPPAPAAAWPPPSWLDELNLDPRYRVVAGMGTAVVQKEQEQLMASAWEQLGEIDKINQRLRQAQLSRAVNSVYHTKSFSRFSEEAFVRVVAPVQSRLLVVEEQAPGTPAAKTLLAKKLAGSFVPSSAISAPLRKLARPRGAINRPYAQAGAPGVQAVFNLFNTSGTATPADVTAPDKGAVTIEKVCQRVQNTGGLIWSTDPPPPHWQLPSEHFTQMLNTFRLSNLSDSAISTRPRPATHPGSDIYDAAKAHQEYLTRLFTSPIPAEFRTVISTSEIQVAVLMSLNPARTISQAVLASIRVNSPRVQTGDELDPIMDAPTFPQPMYEALRDLSQDLLFPGLENVLPNTVALLKSNTKFIEAFLVGLNAEMSRELLWRGYPTDQRGTYFQQFWEAVGAPASSDIPPIHQWGTRALGNNVTGAAAGGNLVLLIRGDLLRRYPNTVIYAVRAVRNGAQHVFPPEPADEVHPIFRGTLEPDVTFLGFNLPPDQPVPDPGWFFVIQQQPTEARFGLDPAPFSDPSGPQTLPELQTWDNLSWGHLAQDETALKALSHVAVNNIQLTTTGSDKGVWGRNAAHMAYITKQLPVRIAIHATEIIP